MKEDVTKLFKDMSIWDLKSESTDSDGTTRSSWQYKNFNVLLTERKLYSRAIHLDYKNMYIPIPDECYDDIADKFRRKRLERAAATYRRCMEEAEEVIRNLDK